MEILIIFMLILAIGVVSYFYGKITQNKAQIETDSEVKDAIIEELSKPRTVDSTVSELQQGKF